MGICLDEERQILPTVKLADVGNWLSGAIVNMETRVDMDPKTNKPKLNAKGKKKSLLILTVMVRRWEGATLGTGGEWREPVASELGRVFVQGSTWGWWIEAKKKHADAGHKLEVGDIIRWSFDGTTPNPTSGESDFKNRKFDIHKPGEKESQMVLECERLYHELSAGTAETSQPEPELEQLPY